ncbi:MAG: hypothetical protein HC892_02770 [Saprospiraceae bacterium]|nr:hypothetical protein [Saprospiraceae bacterium]
MRVIGYIEHPSLKISVFKMDEKYVVKFESGFYEQIFKFKADEYINGLEAVQRVIDAEFISSVERSLPAMHQLRMQALSRLLPPVQENEFDKLW